MGGMTVLDPHHVVGYLWGYLGIIPMCSWTSVLYGSGVDHYCPDTRTWQNDWSAHSCLGWRFVFVRTAPGDHPRNTEGAHR